MSWVVELLVQLYLGIVLFLLGGGLLDEASNTNPNYGEAIVFALFWPIAIPYYTAKYNRNP